MKKFILILALVFAVLIISGCASTTSNANFFVSNAAVAKQAEATNHVWFGLFGDKNYPSAAQVALDNGIHKIASVERYVKAGIFGLWLEYTTIVSGE